MERSSIIWLLCTAAVMLGMPGTGMFVNSDTFMVLVVLEFL